MYYEQSSRYHLGSTNTSFRVYPYHIGVVLAVSCYNFSITVLVSMSVLPKIPHTRMECVLHFLCVSVCIYYHFFQNYSFPFGLNFYCTQIYMFLIPGQINNSEKEININAIIFWKKKKKLINKKEIIQKQTNTSKSKNRKLI